MNNLLNSDSHIDILLPAEICIYDKDKKVKKYRGEIYDLYESGATLILFDNIKEVYDNSVLLRLFLPPCYSNDNRNSMIFEISSKLDCLHKNSQKKPKKYDLKFNSLNITKKQVLTKIMSLQKESINDIKRQKEIKRPEVMIRREVHSCHMYSIDLSIGCSHECIYCHFSENNVRQAMKKFPEKNSYPLSVDINPLFNMKEYPKSVLYLSPASDPFARESRELTHEVLSYLLPKGVIFAISTKTIIPEKTIRLLNKYSNLIESVAIGITSLDIKRNKIIEPNIPDPLNRLDNARDIIKSGCPVFVRIDPIFPGIDDLEDSLRDVIDRVHKAKVKNITGAYLFSYGRNLKKMKQISYLRESINSMTEKSYQMGGKAYSLPLDKKRKTYNNMYEICKTYSILFNTCGCKEIRLQNEKYPLVCRNMNFYS